VSFFRDIMIISLNILLIQIVDDLHRVILLIDDFRLLLD